MHLLSSFTRAFACRSNYLNVLRGNRGRYGEVLKRHGSSYEPDGKSTLHILNKETDLGLMIDSYSQVGFRLNNGMYVLGPMAIFPRSVLSWNVSGAEEINEDSLTFFCHLEPKIDILVLGVGDNAALTKLNRDIIRFMRSHRINVEALTTEQACSTFNFLNAENRYVAGALIPPNEIRTTEDDIVTTRMKRKKLYEVDDDFFVK